MSINLKSIITCAVTSLLLVNAVNATEGGGSMYPMGAENYLVGALPPEGVYPLIYAQRYEADDLKDGSGNSVMNNFHLTANVLAPRLLWVTDQQVAGGQLLLSALLPLVDLEVKAGGLTQRNQGIGDVDFTVALAYHHNENLHSAVGFDIFAPTGKYDQNDLANIGRNYWGFEPVYALSYVDPTGFNWGIKLMYDYNLKNQDTNYRSGQEFHADYAFGYAVSPNWVVGLGGYVYKQVTDDDSNGSNVGNKGQALAIGPSIKYDNGKGFFISAKYQKELEVKNRPEGDALWLKTVVKF